MAALVLCLFAFVLSSNEAWAAEQPSSTEQQQSTTGESTTIVNRQQVAEPAPTSHPLVTTPPVVETSLTETLPPPPPSGSVPPKAEPQSMPQPAPQPMSPQRTVVITTTGITTTGNETVWPSGEPGTVFWQSEPTSTEESVPTTRPSEPASISSASAAPAPDLGSPETEGVPATAAAAEEIPAEVPAALPASISVPSEVAEPLIPVPPALQQVAQGVGSQEQAQSVYSSLGIAPASTAVQPLTQGLTNFVGTSAAAVANAAANVLGTVGGWLAAEAPSGDEDGSSSSGGATMPEPFDPVSPQPLGSSFISLFSGGGGQTSAGGAAGAPLLLGVLFLGSLVLLRRDLRMYLVSCEVAKPSSALLSPLERPG